MNGFRAALAVALILVGGLFVPVAMAADQARRISHAQIPILSTSWIAVPVCPIGRQACDPKFKTEARPHSVLRASVPSFMGRMARPTVADSNEHPRA